MCGIAGHYGSFAPERLGHANRLQVHRGPDANGNWFDTEAGTGLIVEVSRVSIELAEGLR